MNSDINVVHLWIKALKKVPIKKIEGAAAIQDNTECINYFWINRCPI